MKYFTSSYLLHPALSCKAQIVSLLVPTEEDTPIQPAQDLPLEAGMWSMA